MTAARWQQVKAIFDATVESDPSVRAELLRERCGNDEELRREVESLLASDRDAGSMMEHPVLGPPATPEATVVVRILKDRYEIERELGRGGMSVVYLARDRQLLSKRVVVKVLLEETSQDSWIRQKFQQEMEALARIDHPGVVGVLDSGFTPEGKQFLVMQYIEGASLRSAIEPGGMNHDRAAGIIRQIGQALEAAHEKGVWHRDLKPENIMLQRLGGEDHVKLIDFGLAGIQNSQFAGEESKVAGSLSYMAPEQFAGQACAASDTYALGVVAYEILTGDLPAPREGSRAELPAAVEKSIRKAMSFRPEHRQSSVREFSEELYYALRGSEPARGSGPVRKSGSPGSVEIAHVLFTDLVGYSLLPMDRQKEYLGELQQIVRESPQFRAAEAAGDIISLPTGDGMALAFFGDPTAPAQCALEVAQGLKSKPHLKLRMGIHSGPVYRVADVNANANVAGGGINMAQRVMDCGDAGHILVSKTVADVLLQLSQWAPHLTDLGEFTVKHGVKVHLYNLATTEAGNRERPRKLAPAAIPKWKSKSLVAGVAALAVAVAAGGWWLGRSGRSSLTSRDQSSIAVLAFRDLSPEQNQAYFSEGLAEELLDTLSKIQGLKVAARTSSFLFGVKPEDCRVIGQKLNVANILEGSVRKQGNRAKISTQLIKTADCFEVWSADYDRELTDFFAVQEEVARAVTANLKLKLLGEPKATPSPRSKDADAYNAYLEGRYLIGKRNKENLEKAVGYFEQAIGLDPGYAPAWAELSLSHTIQASGAYVPGAEGYRKAREEVDRALKLDADLAAAHAAMGYLQLTHDRDWAGADVSFRRARELDPGNDNVIRGAASLAMNLGRLDEAIALYSRAVEIDPLNPTSYHQLGIVLYYAGRQAEAAAAFKHALELAPERSSSHCLLGRLYLVQSHPQEALAEMEQEKQLSWRLFGLALAYHALGKKKESDENLAELIEKFSKGNPYQVAEVYAFRGETDLAFQWLARAYTEPDSALREIKSEPLLNNLRRDPRYAALLKKMGLPL
jgi:serine/threonine protein kinase/TolB-like protein/lipoprotein NlpI